MTIKQKIYLALTFLSLVILLLGGIGSYYLVRLARDAEAIIKDNYRTLDYMQFFQQGLDEIQFGLMNLDSSFTEKIEEQRESIKNRLSAQLQNITEPGEKQMSQFLLLNYEKFDKKIQEFMTRPDTINDYDQRQMFHTIREMKEQSRRIYLLNEQSMLAKNEKAKRTADQVVLYMLMFGICAASIAILFLIVFPPYIANPIMRLNDAIKEIAKGNYKYKLKVASSDEFGQLSNSFNLMASRLEEFENSNLANLMFEKKRLDEVINQMNEAILGLNEKKEVIFANERILGLIGSNRDDLLGRYAPDLAVNNPTVQQLIGELMMGNDLSEDHFKPLKLLEDDKQKIFVKNIVDVVDTLPEKGRVTLGYVIILTDITEFAERDLAKTHFMATLTHELKTPSAAIEMSLGLLRNKKVGALNMEQKALLKTIDENNMRIRSMIKEVLDLSKIESGIIDLKIEPTNPIHLIEQAVKGVNPFLEEKQIKIKRSIEGKMPEIKVDPHKTVWVLNNFLINAIRYTAENGTVVVKGECHNGEMVISVIDKGKGISEENQRKIFNRYSRLEEKQDGTGLGLAISKEFVEAMGGSIGVLSEEGYGSRFWIKFPGVL